MISLITNKEDLRLPKGEEFIEAKILSLLYSYGTEYSFCTFWQGKTENKITSAICKFEDTVFLSCSSSADFLELRKFLEVIGYGSIQAEVPILESLSFKGFEEYLCLKSQNSNSKGDNEDFSSLPLKDVYEILFSQEHKNLKKPDFDGWYADLSHRLRRERALVLTSNTSAAAIVSHIGDTAAVISGVAVLPEQRKSGIGTKLIMGIKNRLDDKEIYTATDKNTASFYIKCGFKAITKIGVL